MCVLGANFLQQDSCEFLIVDRMPNPIAGFISQQVYDGQLDSQLHVINSPSCLALIDIPRTGEESVGSSCKLSFLDCASPSELNHHLSKEYGGDSHNHPSREAILQNSGFLRHYSIRCTACFNTEESRG